MSPDSPDPKFRVGQLVHHLRFGYRGVIVGVDRVFEGTEVWYEEMARSRPPKDRPWYHVLVHGATHQTYVTEQNLEGDSSALPIEHPLMDHYFLGMKDGAYTRLLN